ncbi:MAG: hypothetical protein ACR2PL_27985 [Dehalococcoidia bacterium]
MGRSFLPVGLAAALLLAVRVSGVLALSTTTTLAAGESLSVRCQAWALSATRISATETKLVCASPAPAVAATTKPAASSAPTAAPTTGSSLMRLGSPTVSLAPPSRFPLHQNITATVFWIGEPKGNGSSENSALSAWDDAWEQHYGGYDDYQHRNGSFPAAFTPKENPFYFDLPYNDFDDTGNRRADAAKVVPWAGEKQWGAKESMLKNRWIRITKGDKSVYAQWEDAGPYQYDDSAYVFGTALPVSTLASNAGMDVSPAVRDVLGFNGLNTDGNKVGWQFVSTDQVPNGPWKAIVTTSQVYWP